MDYTKIQKSIEISMQNLRDAARRMLEINLRVKPGEHIVVVTDRGMNRRIATAAYMEACCLFGLTHVSMIPITSFAKRAESAPLKICGKYKKAFLSADVIIAPTERSVTHAPETKEASDNGARVASMPATREIDFIQALSGGMDSVQAKARHVVKQLAGKEEIRITSTKGTDITIHVDPDDIPFIDDGDLSLARTVGNIPYGEIAKVPIIEKGNGVIVFSLSSATNGDATLWVKDGKIIKWDYEAEHLMEQLNTYPNGNHLAEFAIGINPEIRYEPDNPDFDKANSVRNEKIHGTCHFGLGNIGQITKGFCSDIRRHTGIHEDVIILEPRFFSEGKEIDMFGKGL